MDPQLVFADDGSPRSGRFGDIYYSLDDGLSEARAVFLRGCRLPENWGGWSDFTVLELGFGTGLNIAALMQLWAAHRPAGGHLHAVSIEGFAMTGEDAARALSAWPELAEFAAALVRQWPKARRGFHHMDFPQWGVSVTLILMEVREALAAWDGQADAIFLDGFSPARNPDMWAADVLAAVGRKARPGARLATFTVAGGVRRDLARAGFRVQKRPGFGRKRERLEALFTPGHGYVMKHRPARIAIVGAGIGGAALACQARLIGLDSDIFDPGPGSGASGNAMALVTPRLDAGDNAISQLYADAFAYSTALYRRLCPEAIAGQGVHQAEMTAKDASRFARIAVQTGFAPGDLRLFAAGDAVEMPGAAGIAIDSALWLRPDIALPALLDGQEIIRAAMVATDGRFLTDDRGRRHGPYDAVIVAAGEGIFDLADYRARYDLRAVRGQVEAVASEVPLRSALSWGGYAVPLAGGYVFGATHERDDRGCDIRLADRARNLDSLARAMPARAAALTGGAFRSRASVRVMTRDYLPVAGRAGGVWLLTGLGARGFCLAPLLARALLSEITGAPWPLAAIAKSLLDPARLIAPSRT